MASISDHHPDHHRASRALASYNSLRVLRVGQLTTPDPTCCWAATATRSTWCRCGCRTGCRSSAPRRTTLSTRPRPGSAAGFHQVQFRNEPDPDIVLPAAQCKRFADGAADRTVLPHILPPVEQFYLGGARFTRGYYSGQVSGDKALAATAELQFNTGFNFTSFGLARMSRPSSTCSTTGARHGRTNRKPWIEHISSTGGGVRMQLTRYAEVDFEGWRGSIASRPASGQHLSACMAALFTGAHCSRF